MGRVLSYDVVIAPGYEARFEEAVSDLNADESLGVDEALRDLEAVNIAPDEAIGVWHDGGVKHEIGVVPAPGAAHIALVASHQAGAREVQIHRILKGDINHARKAAPGISSKSLDLGPNRHWETIP